MVRTLQFTTIGAFLERFHGQRVMATAHVALGGGRFSLWNSHGGTYFFQFDKQDRKQNERPSNRQSL
jgi:hypothetical protein